MNVIFMALLVGFFPQTSHAMQTSDIATVQLIHASPDPVLASVDVYLNGELLLRDFRFQEATPFLEINPDRRNSVVITRNGDRPENGIAASLTVMRGEQYFAVVKGVLDPGSFAPNPSGISTEIQVSLIAANKQEFIDEDVSIIRFINASPDAPQIELQLNNSDFRTRAVAFGGSSNLFRIEAAEQTFNLLNASPIFDTSDGSSLSVIQGGFDFRRLAGESVLIMNTGFVNTRRNASFADDAGATQQAAQLLIIRGNGDVIRLSPPRAESAAPSFTAEDIRFGTYPNPFNPTTTITYTLPDAADVRLEVFNMQGQRVAVLINGRQAAGTYNIRFDALNLSSGIYLTRLQAGSFSQVLKMTLMK